MTEKSKSFWRGSITPFFLIFTISGFAGLIYESIWTHYLKLFLGHAAFSQTIVLAMFMGGMSLGSWICSRYSSRWSNLIKGYAIVEFAIGIAALLFHQVFIRFLDLSYDTVLPNLDSPAIISVWKWVTSGLLILPQSILIGMTFPLMTAGLLRRFPEKSGSTISLLYFTNSLGAAVGVLVSGFFLIGQVGLPGTLVVAGCLNILLSLIVWNLSSSFGGDPERGYAKHKSLSEGYRLFLVIALATGAASFIYEISWIRMLSLVLGSSTHSFELMLSAFITGLAFGGLWIRRRIDKLNSPVMFLGGIQLAMGILALGTLPLYANSFELMGWLMANLPKTDVGYVGFNLASHGIALAVMLPATFCAGTTLPLITHVLLQGGNGEKSIGAVYAWNTIGAIAGVGAAIHIGMPLLGVKGLLVAGAIIDIILGVVLIGRVGRSRLAVTSAIAAAVIVLGIVVFVPLEAHKMASGVFRASDPNDKTVVFHRDGKTATVSVTGDPDSVLVIRTNGKPDASLSMSVAAAETVDEHTMILLGFLPIALYPEAKTVANIGMGSGLSTHAVLSSTSIERVDTIEIEPAMVEGARFFGKRVARAFEDPRSRLHFDDAKAYFSSRNAKYDVIISEPSNPWVSGVSSLFSQEFYHRIQKYLSEGGLFVQWLQLYEMNESLVVSILKALDQEFVDFHVYAANHADLVIVASDHRINPKISDSFFSDPRWKQQLQRISLDSPADIDLRWVANKTALTRFIKQYPVATNSDYYPVVDLWAVRSRFMGDAAIAFASPELKRLPVLEMLGGQAMLKNNSKTYAYSTHSQYAQTTHLASSLLDYVVGGEWSWGHKDLYVPPKLRAFADKARDIINSCQNQIDLGTWLDGMYNTVARRVLPFVTADEMEQVWSRLEAEECWSALDDLGKDFTLMWKALGNRDAWGMVNHGDKILRAPVTFGPRLIHHIASIAVLGHVSLGNLEEAREIWANHASEMLPEDTNSLRTQILLSFLNQAASTKVQN